MDNIKITQGNAFSLVLPLRARSYTSDGAFTDEDIDATQLTDIVVTFGKEQVTASTTLQGVQIDLPATLARDSYDIVLTATYNGHAIRAAYLNAITIVKWSQQSNAEQYLLGSPITCDAAYVIASLTDSELENLKQTYAQKIAEAEQAKEEYEQAKEELQNVAQQGGNPLATNTAILEAVGGIDIDTNELAKQGSNAEANISDIQSIVSDISLSSQTLGSLADSWAAMVTNRSSLEGYTFVDNIPVDNIRDLLYRRDLLYSIADSNITTISCDYAFYACSALTSLSLPALTTMSGGSTFNSCSALTSVSLPALTTMNDRTFNSCSALTSVSLPALTTTGPYAFYGCSALTRLSLPALTSVGGNHTFFGCSALTSLSLPALTAINTAQTFTNCVNLIDIEMGAAMTASFNIVSWSPTNALRADSQTLLTQEDLDNGFTSNLEKLLYNIREHIAANLPVAPNTITFSAAVKSAINADQATADAITNKNWIIA